jgi:endonuclease/exonuclease/phosphatase family metal-dependent hydrolase
MSHPIRISVTTFNVWGDKLWPERSEPLIDTLNAIKSDVYLFQEVTKDIISCLDENLVDYSRVQQGNKEGWMKESNIYWNNTILDLVDFGFGDLAMPDYPLRGLFWVRLCLKGDNKKTIFCSTAHFPWVGCQTEIETGINQRIPASIKVCEHLRRLVPPQEPAVFCGDLNEDYHPVRILNEELAFTDVFESLDLVPPSTHPVRPSSPEEEMKPNQTLDWILCSLPTQCRVVAAFAKTVRRGKFPPASDHMPVVAVLEIA